MSKVYADMRNEDQRKPENNNTVGDDNQLARAEQMIKEA